MPCIKQFIDHRLIPTYMGNSINGDYMEFADTVNPHVHGELFREFFKDYSDVG